MDIFGLISKILVIAVGIAGAVFAIFRFVAFKWLENQFATKLAKEVEFIKFDINRLYNRIVKIHEKEFEVLSEAWSKLIDALNYMGHFVNYVQTFPDIARMSQDDFEEFVEELSWSKRDKKELLGSHDKTKLYKEMKFDYDTKLARDKFSIFHVYLQKNSIFLHKDLKNKFDEIDDFIWDAFRKRIIGEKANDLKAWQDANEAITEGVKPLQSEIESMTQTRLRFEQADS